MVTTTSFVIIHLRFILLFILSSFREHFNPHFSTRNLLLPEDVPDSAAHIAVSTMPPWMSVLPDSPRSHIPWRRALSGRPAVKLPYLFSSATPLLSFLLTGVWPKRFPVIPCIQHPVDRRPFLRLFFHLHCFRRIIVR